MKSLARPTITSEEVFRTCSDAIADQELKARLLSVVEDVVAAEQEYLVAGSAEAFHTITPSSDVGGVVTRDEMVTLYDAEMVGPKGGARDIYNSLRVAAPYGKCPFCGVGTVTTLEHHLPKSRYCAFAVSPCNLVPACHDCNVAKGSKWPQKAEMQTLHPYFDKLEGVTWLRAEVVESDPPSLVYTANAVDGLSALTVTRLRRHLEVFKLHALFSSNAANELVNIRAYLELLNTRGGEVAVQAHLTEMSTSYAEAQRNSWQSAMYAALRDNNWFTSGGFFKIPQSPSLVIT